MPPQSVEAVRIGCSSKTTAYFVAGAHGFNAVHGRMPSIATGANAANRHLRYIGVSGDGDSLSIGVGQLAHAIRRNLDMVYILENNGVYGLTKGQFSASRRRLRRRRARRTSSSRSTRSCSPSRSGRPSSRAVSRATKSSSSRSSRPASPTRVSPSSTCSRRA
jgi:TPP-dependent indolepyruvate ferredoxin oxidoreductase alpha subunit